MVERKRQNDSWAGERGRSKEARVVKVQTEVDALLVTQGHDDVGAWAAAQDQDLVHIPDAALGVCDVVCGSCYHQEPYGCLESGTLPVTKIMCKGCASTRVMLIQYSYTATQDHGNILPRLPLRALSGSMTPSCCPWLVLSSKAMQRSIVQAGAQAHVILKGTM